jgi:Peptidase family M50
LHKLRGFLAWVFAFTALVCVRIAFTTTLQTIHGHYNLLVLRNLLVLLAPAMNAVQCLVFGAAWWTIWKGRPSARRWGIAGSLIYVLLFCSLAYFQYLSRSGWSEFRLFVSMFWVILAIGIAGLIAFLRPFQQAPPIPEIRNIPGDGTNNVINKAAPFVAFAAGLWAYHWWIGWIRANGSEENGWDRVASATLIGLLITLLHELGHTTAGLVLGMKLRAFIAGPFQWRVHDGKWKFQFRPLEVLVPGGATSVVPRSVDFPRWRSLCMIAAGPLVTMVSGIFALWIGLREAGDSRLPADGLPVLFGAWSLVICAMNLVPIRTKDGQYSDGAMIYQSLSKGPWGDYHRIMTAVSSSVVTPLRPRDYDIQTILRLARSFTQGRQGLVLLLYAYSYFLDHGKLSDAAQAIREAGLIYQQCSSEIPAELLTVFVFVNAYICGDAAAVRGWWTHMQARKPTQFNVDYWRAYSALHWVEGNLKEANEAWKKSNEIAQQLPKAGAYEFDRYCCALLRKVLDGSAVATTASSL